MGAQVVWTRLLSLPLRSYAYSFSLMLALFLLGLVLGAFVVSLLADRVRAPVRLLGWVEVRSPLLALAAAPKRPF